MLYHGNLASYWRPVLGGWLVSMLHTRCEQHCTQQASSLRNQRLLSDIVPMLDIDQNVRPYAPKVAQQLAVTDSVVDAETQEPSIILSL